MVMIQFCLGYIFKRMHVINTLGWLLKFSHFSGRAGRERPGKCFRLYPESEFGQLADSTEPEIKRCNLSNVILQLKALGVDDIIGFDFLEKPSRLKFFSNFTCMHASACLLMSHCYFNSTKL